MPDATNTVTVDGVEPSILVKLNDITDNPGRVKIFTADDGTERYVTKDNEILVTPQDLSVLGSVSYEVLNNDTPAQTSPAAPTFSAPKPAEVVSSPVNSIGQSSPQVQ